MTPPLNFSGVPQQPQAMPPYGINQPPQRMPQQPMMYQQFGVVPDSFQGQQPMMVSNAPMMRSGRANLALKNQQLQDQIDTLENQPLPAGGNPVGVGALAVGAAGATAVGASEVAYRWDLDKKLAHEHNGREIPATPLTDTEKAEIKIEARKDAIDKLNTEALQTFKQEQLTKAQAIVTNATSVDDAIVKLNASTPEAPTGKLLKDKDLAKLKTDIETTEDLITKKTGEIQAVRKSGKWLLVTDYIKPAEDIALGINFWDRVTRQSSNMRAEAQAAFMEPKIAVLKSELEKIAPAHKAEILKLIDKNNISGANQYMATNSLRGKGISAYLPDIKTGDGGNAYLDYLESQPKLNKVLTEKQAIVSEQTTLAKQIEAHTKHTQDLNKLKELKKVAPPIHNTTPTLNEQTLQAEINRRITDAESKLVQPKPNTPILDADAKGFGKAWQNVDDLKAKGFTELAEHSKGAKGVGWKAGALVGVIGAGLTLQQFFAAGKAQEANAAKEAKLAQLRQQQADLGG
jgi:hypothetical protein